MLSKCIYLVFLVSIVSALLFAETHAGLLDRLLYMMVRNRRRQPLITPPFSMESAHFALNPTYRTWTVLRSGLRPDGLTTSEETDYMLSPFGNLAGSLAPYYPLSLSNLASSVGPTIPYSQYLASLASYGGIPPIAPLGPWGGINPLFPYLNFADYPDYRSLPSLPNYLALQAAFPPPLYAPPIPNFSSNALNTSDFKEDKKLSSRVAGLAYNIQGADRKKLLTDLKYLSNHRLPPNYRPPYLLPDATAEDLIDALR